MACMRKRRGRWVVDFRDHTGARRWETYATKDEATAALADRTTDLRDGRYRPPDAIPTFREAAERWLATRADHRAGTLAVWENHVRRRLIPWFEPEGSTPRRINGYTLADLERLKTALRTTLTPSTTNAVLRTLKAIFKHASKHGDLVHNVAADLDRCRMDARALDAEANPEADEAIDPNTILDATEAGRLIEAADPGFDQTAIAAAVYTGLRVGELSGLQWTDIDLDRRTLAVRRSVSWSRTDADRASATAPRYRIYPPKTKKGRRTVPLPAVLVSILRRWLLQCPGQSENPQGWVFPDVDGGPVPRWRFTSTVLPRTLKAAGLPHVDWHSLRHTYASMLIGLNTPPTQVQAYMGHSSPTVTLGIYSHFFPRHGTDAVDRMAELMAGGGSGSKMVANGGSRPRHRIAATR